MSWRGIGCLRTKYREEQWSAIDRIRMAKHLGSIHFLGRIVLASLPRRATRSGIRTFGLRSKRVSVYGGMLWKNTGSGTKLGDDKDKKFIAWRNEKIHLGLLVVTTKFIHVGQCSSPAAANFHHKHFLLRFLININKQIKRDLITIYFNWFMEISIECSWVMHEVWR